MPGRPPKPTSLKILHGTDRPDRLNAQEPKPPVLEDAKPPTWLKARGRQEWKRIAPMLLGLNLLTVADTDALALLCDALGEYIQARDVIRRDGATYRTFTESGSELWRPRPEVAMASDAWRRVLRMMTDFGMTPSSRSKVRASGQEQADPFEEFMSGSRGTG